MLKKYKIFQLLVLKIIILISLIYSADIYAQDLEGNKVLFVIDMQNDFLADNAKMPVDKNQGIQIINTVNKLIENYQNLNMEVLYINSEFPKSDYIFNFFRNNAAIQGTIGAEFDTRIKLINKNIFIKNKSSAFTNPNLEKFLIEKNIKHIYIAGLYAEHCVLATAKDAFKKGYKVYVIGDGVATKTDKNREKALKKYKNYGLNVINSDELLIK